jgi:hypothetical protein
MPMFFTVVPNGRRVPVGARSRAFLLVDNWDDWFTYNTMYSLIVYDARGEEFQAGGVKIRNVSMILRHPWSGIYC